MIDPKLQTIFKYVKRHMLVIENFEEMEIELSDEVYNELVKMSKQYGHDLNTIVNGLLDVEINRLQGIENEKET